MKSYDFVKKEVERKAQNRDTEKNTPGKGTSSSSSHLQSNSNTIKRSTENNNTGINASNTMKEAVNNERNAGRSEHYISDDDTTALTDQ